MINFFKWIFCDCKIGLNNLEEAICEKCNHTYTKCHFTPTLGRRIGTYKFLIPWLMARAKKELNIEFKKYIDKQE